MKVLVTFAVEREFARWRRLRNFRRAALAVPSLYEARIGHAEVRVVLTGIGPQHARHAMELALLDGADLCVSSGLAGALRSRYCVGDILVAHAVQYSSPGKFVKSDSGLLRSAAVCGARPVEAFQSVDRAVLTAADKGRISSAADAVEMESYAILSMAGALRIPAVAIRVIGDASGQDLPLDFNRTVSAQGRISVPRVFAELARRPQRLPGLIRLGRDTRRAAARLAHFLDRYVEALAAPPQTEEVLEQVAAG
jgi:nucleoside phosphorylase